MAYYSYIPYRMREYTVSEDVLLKKQIERIHRLFEELNRCLDYTEDDILDSLVVSEARASWLLASDNAGNPFMIPDDTIYNEDIRNIERAYRYAVDVLSEIPLCSRLFRDIHYIVCESSTYDKKYRGEYRTSPVWIGSPGCVISEASFIPPAGSDMTEAISDLEIFINYSNLDAFVKAAMIHYQFEMIHPFIDANGRVGRIINTLFLYETGALQKPTLLFSHAISASVGDYYNAIQHVNLTLDMDSWIRYFLSKLECGVEYTIHHITARNG